MSGSLPLREAALAAIAERIITGLPDVALDRARRAPVDVEAEALKLWNIVEIGLGGYVIGRSAEKTLPRIVEVLKR